MRTIAIHAVTLGIALAALFLIGCTDSGGPTAVTVDIGQRVELEGYPDIIVERFERRTDAAQLAEDYGYGEGYEYRLEPGHEVWVLRLRVINNTDKPGGVSLGGLDLHLFSRGENIYQATRSMMNTPDAFDAEILPPGAEAVGNVAWAVAQGFDDLQLRYRPFSASGLELFDPENLFDNPVGDLPVGFVNLEPSP